MLSEHSTTCGAVPIRDGIVVLSGYGVRVRVDRRHLAVEDGCGLDRRQARFAKAPSRLKRLLVIAQTGFVSLEALRWLKDAGAAFIQLDYDGSILMASIDGLDDARLRRAQAMLPVTAQRLELSRELLLPKLQGQLAVVDSFDLEGGEAIRAAIASLEKANAMEGALIAEAKAAEAYWDAWSSVRLEFARRDHVPDHWRTFSNRRSSLTLGSRNAANPLNALLNYLYALLEVETRVALIARGLDPGLGLFHTDTANRQSLAADVMEPVRPHVDAYVLKLARTRTFSANHFCETREGACRLSSSLTQELAGTMVTWARLVAPYAELTARSVARLAQSGDIRVLGGRTPRARVKLRVGRLASPAQPVAAKSVPVVAFSNACRDCGVKLSVRKRIYCDQCLPSNRDATLRAHGENFQAAGPAKLATMRSQGFDPTKTPEALRRRAASASAQRRAVVSWKDDGSLSGVDFKRDILPGLQQIPVKAIAEAMGASLSHGSKVRNGHLIPHKRHWKTLRTLAPV